MPLTPEDVRNKRFTPVRLREGYDMGEVDQFLDEVEAELERLTVENEELRSKVAAASSGVPTGIIPAVAPAPAPVAVVREPEPEPIPLAPIVPEPVAPAPLSSASAAPTIGDASA